MVKGTSGNMNGISNGYRKEQQSVCGVSFIVVYSRDAFYGIFSAHFANNSKAQKAALWLQILLCSCIPLIIFFLSLSLVNNLTIAWITSWISVVHLGLVFADEGLGPYAPVPLSKY